MIGSEWMRVVALPTLFVGLVIRSERVEAGVRYYHTDHLGSVVAVTDENREVVERREYEPFGLQLRKLPAAGPGFIGHVHDRDTGMDYMQQRYYDPVLGRFLSADPASPYLHAGENFNRYKYGANNPYRFVDPDGRVDWEMVGDSVKGEVALSLGLRAKMTLGPVKLQLGIGEMSYGGGATLAPDGYAFQEVAGPSAGLEVGGYGLGYRGSQERSYQWRQDQSYSEDSQKGGAMFGKKNAELAVEEGSHNAEMGSTFSVFPIKVGVSVDLGKMGEGLRRPSPVSRQPGFKGVFRVGGRIESARLAKRMKEHGS